MSAYVVGDLHIDITIEESQLIEITEDGGVAIDITVALGQNIDVNVGGDEINVQIQVDSALAFATLIQAQTDLALALELIRMEVVTVTEDFPVAVADAGKMYLCDSATAINATIQFEAEAGEVGEIICLTQSGVGVVNLVADSGVTLISADSLNTRTINSVIGIVRISQNTWQAMGDLGYYV